MNKTKIDWGIPNLYTWNPVVGCKHNCSYCYAKKINDRFHYIENWEDPQFFIERLTEPNRHKISSTIFVGSMCDLFGEWVPDEWINIVLHVVKDNPQHTLMFLTKNPKRYHDFVFPRNAIIGTTVTGDSKTFYRIDELASNSHGRTFLSIEPLLGMMDYDLKPFDQVIVGAMTGPGAIKPKQEWIDSIKHPNIFWKPSIKGGTK